MGIEEFLEALIQNFGIWGVLVAILAFWLIRDFWPKFWSRRKEVADRSFELEKTRTEETIAAQRLQAEGFNKLASAVSENTATLRTMQTDLLIPMAARLTTVDAKLDVLSSDNKAVRIGIMSVDIGGIITHVDEGAAELFGVRKKDLIGLALSDSRLNICAINGEVLPVQQYPPVRAIKNNMPVRPLLLGVRLPDDPDMTHWILMAARPTGVNGNASGSIIVVANVRPHIESIERELVAYR